MCNQDLSSYCLGFWTYFTMFNCPRFYKYTNIYKFGALFECSALSNELISVSESFWIKQMSSMHHTEHKNPV